MEKMSMSVNVEFESTTVMPIRALEYHDMATHPVSNGSLMQVLGVLNTDEGSKRRADVELSHEEFAERIRQERSDAALQAEQRLRQEFDLKLKAVLKPIEAAISAFEAQRSEYYARVESEVVQLTLAIAAKILHREAQVDPMLVAALVRVAVEKLREGSAVTIRVGPGRASSWREYFAGQSDSPRVQVIEDAALSQYDCMLETELGVVNFGLDAQLKEVERGFFDLLALRPVK
jgi:flagellar assembly protein FliH